jgi:hypothetical protein
MHSCKQLLGVLALVGFVISIIVHVATIFGFVPSRPFWLLHVGVFLVFVPMIPIWNRLVMSRLTGRSLVEAQRAHGELFWQSLRAVPIYVKTASLLCIAYYLAISSLGLAFGVAGAPPARLICSFSGGWMFFYLIPMVFFFWVEPRAREIQELARKSQPQRAPSANQQRA